MRGIDLFTVAKLMGHSSIDMVVRVYSHLSPDHKRRAMAQLGAWLGSLHLTEDAA
jgi:integrase